MSPTQTPSSVHTFCNLDKYVRSPRWHSDLTLHFLPSSSFNKDDIPGLQNFQFHARRHVRFVWSLLHIADTTIADSHIASLLNLNQLLLLAKRRREDLYEMFSRILYLRPCREERERQRNLLRCLGAHTVVKTVATTEDETETTTVMIFFCQRCLPPPPCRSSPPPPPLACANSL